MRADRIFVGEDDGAIEDVAELAYVARPAVVEQHFAGSVGEAEVWAAMEASEVIEKEIDEQADVVAAIAEWRQVQLEDAEAIVKVLAKAFVADILLEILICGGDDANIDGYFFGATDGQERVAFENSQQFCLAFERELADFIEEQRAEIGLLKKADVIAIGARE